jgi:hypothetical protein
LDSYRNLEGAGDFNSDGIGDLVAFRQSDGCFARWAGTGTGGLTYIGDLLCDRPASNVVIGLGDLNRDGKADLAGTDLVTTSMVTYFGDGAGVYTYSGQHFCCYGDYSLT